jgi:hypothetical protein
VEVLCQVPLVTQKETIREVPQKETVHTEKLVELHTTEEVIKLVEVMKEIHHDRVQEVASIVEVERPKNVILIRELIAQVCVSARVHACLRSGVLGGGSRGYPCACVLVISRTLLRLSRRNRIGEDCNSKRRCLSHRLRI